MKLPARSTKGPGRTGRRAIAFSALSVSALLLFACAHREEPAPRVAGPVDPAWVPGGYGEPGPPSPQSWKKDADGRRYYVVAIPNDPARARWLGTETVRFGSVATYSVERFDEKFIYVRFYEAREAGPPPLPSPSRPESISLPAGSARFELQPFGEGLPRSGQWRNGFAIADMNADGWPDIVHGPARKAHGTPVIFLSDGRGHWTRDAASTFPALPYDYGDAAVADFNGDGIPDIALGIHLHGLTVLVGDGHGGYATWARGLDLRRPNEPGPEPFFSSRAIAVADWNGDGRPDLLAISDGPRPGSGPQPSPTALGFRVCLNRGDGSWAVESDPSDRLFGDGLAVGDVDGDGHPDAVTATSWIGYRNILKLGQGARWENRAIAGLPANALVRAVALADFDHDGRMDVVLSYTAPDGNAWTSGIDLYLSKASGFVRRRVAAAATREGFTALAAGDLDGDGAVDLVAVGTDGSVHVFAGDGHGFLTRDTVLAAPAHRSGCGGSHVAVVDLDRDGRAEIVASFAGESNVLFGSGGCSAGGAIEAWKAKARGK